MSSDMIRSLIKNRLVRGVARFIPEGTLLSYTIGNLGLSDEMTEQLSASIVQYARSKNSTVGELLVDEEIVEDILQLLDLTSKYLKLGDKEQEIKPERIKHETYHC